ncbi:MAG TPA: dTDP-4-dehydrorhamnose reductase [Gemmataceae bacterium]|jgi:dTDP-4-dehydrorhamnose reductase|nr:dTDP-4-dehydrorhamnose reductase [Gemmataceae bacterium]
MRYVVLGAKGQLGRDLSPLLGPDVIPLTRAGLDLSNPTLAKAVLAQHRPDVVINCAAYNFVDLAEKEPETAFAVNALAVHHLARACSELSCRFVHCSTDYVFGAETGRTQPYQETDAPGPISVYGASKLAGEYLALNACACSLVIRTCGLYGLHGTGGKKGNFLETMLRLGREGKPLRVVDDQQCTPSYTLDVATTIVSLIAKQAQGLFHVTNAGSCTWHQLAKHLFEAAQLAVNLTAIPSSGYPTPARRPAYSVLALDALTKAGVAIPRPWEEAVAAYLKSRGGWRVEGGG